VHNFIDFGEVALSNDIAYIVLTFQILKHSEVFEQIKPPLDRGGFLSVGVWTHQVVASCCEYYDFVQISNDDTLLQVQA
jgi:hypothetical protein